MESGERGRQLFAIPAGIALSEVSTCEGGRKLLVCIETVRKATPVRMSSRLNPDQLHMQTHTHSYQGALLHVGLLVCQLALALFPQQPFTCAKASRAPVFLLSGCFCADVCREAASKRRLFLSFARCCFDPLCLCVCRGSGLLLWSWRTSQKPRRRSPSLCFPPGRSSSLPVRLWRRTPQKATLSTTGRSIHLPPASKPRK